MTQMQGISFKAVILATVAMFALDILVGSVLAGVFGEGLRPDMTEQEMEAVFAGLVKNGAYLFWGAVLGTLTTVIGGFIAARTARIVPYKNAFAFGLLGILICSFMADGLPLWYNVLGIVTALPAALFGAYIFKRQMRAKV
jgi:hypothetical protein